MLSHTTAEEWLIPYADGMLSSDERQRIDGHIASCTACRRELGALRQLNLALVSLPPAPPLAYAPFWLKLQAKLPAPPRLARVGKFGFYRRAGLALAVAALAALGAASCAFAAGSALPDSPLYPLKNMEESLRLALAPAPQRLDVELSIAAERLREAQVMASTGKPRLAVNSVRAFRALVPAIVAGERESLDPRLAQNQIRSLDVELSGVQEANATRGDDDAELKQVVMTSRDELDGTKAVSGPVIVPAASAATPTPTSPPVHATAAPRPHPTARPLPSPSDDEHGGTGQHRQD